MTVGKLSSLNCEGCGASLGAEDIQDGLAVCRFCGQSHTVQAKPAVSPPAPRPMTPPHAPHPMTPPPAMRAPKSGSSGAVIGVVVGIVVLGGVVSAVASSSSTGSGSSSHQTGSSDHTPGAVYGQGEAARVHWKGTWYDGHIKEVRGSRYLIGYDGWSDSWDEEVDLTRLQKIGGATSGEKKPRKSKKKSKRKKRD